MLGTEESDERDEERESGTLFHICGLYFSELLLPDGVILLIALKLQFQRRVTKLDSHIYRLRPERMRRISPKLSGRSLGFSLGLLTPVGSNFGQAAIVGPLGLAGGEKVWCNLKQ